MLPPVRVLIAVHLLILIVISWTLSAIELLGPERGWAFHARSWILEQMYLAVAYAEPSAAPTARRRIEELRASRRPTPRD